MASFSTLSYHGQNQKGSWRQHRVSKIRWKSKRQKLEQMFVSFWSYQPITLRPIIESTIPFWCCHVGAHFTSQWRTRTIVLLDSSITRHSDIRSFGKVLSIVRSEFRGFESQWKGTRQNRERDRRSKSGKSRNRGWIDVWNACMSSQTWGCVVIHMSNICMGCGLSFYSKCPGPMSKALNSCSLFSLGMN